MSSRRVAIRLPRCPLGDDGAPDKMIVLLPSTGQRLPPPGDEMGRSLGLPSCKSCEFDAKQSRDGPTEREVLDWFTLIGWSLGLAAVMPAWVASCSSTGSLVGDAGSGGAAGLGGAGAAGGLGGAGPAGGMGGSCPGYVDAATDQQISTSASGTAWVHWTPTLLVNSRSSTILPARRRPWSAAPSSAGEGSSSCPSL